MYVVSVKKISASAPLRSLVEAQIDADFADYFSIYVCCSHLFVSVCSERNVHGEHEVGQMPFASVCRSFVEMLQHVEASVLVGEGKLAMLSYTVAHFSQDGQVEYGLRAYIESRRYAQPEEELPGDAVVPAGSYGYGHDELAELISFIAGVSAVLFRKERHVFLCAHTLESDGKVEVEEVFPLRQEA